MKTISTKRQLSKKNVLLLTLIAVACLAFVWAFEKGQVLGEIMANH